VNAEKDIVGYGKFALVRFASRRRVSFRVLNLNIADVPCTASVLCRDDCRIDLELTREWAERTEKSGTHVESRMFL